MPQRMEVGLFAVMVTVTQKIGPLAFFTFRFIFCFGHPCGSGIFQVATHENARTFLLGPHTRPQWGIVVNRFQPRSQQSDNIRRQRQHITTPSFFISGVDPDGRRFGVQFEMGRRQ